MCRTKQDHPVDIETTWPEKYVPDWEKLKKSKKESPFGEAAFELLKETCTYSFLVAGLIPNEPHERNDAILCALVLKASKLTKAIITMTAHLGGDRQLALARELLEASATLNYLLEDEGDGVLFDRYINDSLVVEREFLKKIAANIGTRGSTLPIEESMKRSVDKTAEAAGVDDLAALPSRKAVGWPSAETLIIRMNPEAYLSYRGGSSVIHTKWHDLLRNHLIQAEDGTFEPNFDDPLPRPQPLYAAGMLLISSLHKYLAAVRPDAAAVFSGKLDDLAERLFKVYAAHSDFLDKDAPRT